MSVASGHLAADGWGKLDKFGYNASVGTTEEDISVAGAVLAWEAAAAVHDIKSSDVNDTAAGTGARTVQVWGLDGSYDEQTEVVSLDGTTDVPTVGEYIRLQRMAVLTAGSGGTAAGTITADVAATVHATIAIGDNQTQQCGWTVPNGAVLFLRRLLVTSSEPTKEATFRLLARPFGGVWQVKTVVLVVADSHTIDFGGLWTFPEKTDIRVACAADAATLQASAALLGVYGPE